MNNCTIEFVDNLSPDDDAKMDKDLVEYERGHGIDVNYQKFSIIIRDANGNTLGILNAYTAFAEIYVDGLWVDKSHRCKGYGRQLLQTLENHFKGKGFNNINLVTNNFQAPQFYKKCGFKVEFVRENIKKPQLSKTFFIKHFDDEVQMQGILESST